MSDGRRWLARLADVGLHRPWSLLIAAAAVTAGFGIYSAGTPIDSSRQTMVSADNPHQAKQMRFLERFGPPREMMIVVSGESSVARQAVVDDLTARLAREPWLEGRILARVGPGYLQTSDGAHHVIALFPELPGDQPDEVRPFVEAIRAHRDAATRGTAIEARLTGAPVLAVDEQAEIQRGILTTSGFTAGGILLLLLLAFRSWRYALLALVPVAVGVTATMAVARLIYGQLNMVTSSCSSMLLALGIDFGVYLLSRYGEMVRAGVGAGEAIREAIARAGKGLFIGGVTTAAAFLTVTTTEFTAYARLGVIVAVGLVIMMLATLSFMPAILWLSGRGKTIEAPEIRGLRVLPGAVRRARAWMIAGAVVLVGVSLTGVGELRFNTRFYDFIPDRVESAEALRIIEHDPALSPLHADVPAGTLAEARALAAELRALPEVATVHAPTDLLPSDATDPRQLPDVFQAQFVSLDGDAVRLTVIPEGDIWEPDTARRFADAVSSVSDEATGLAMHIYTHLAMIRDGFTRAAVMAAVLVLVILLIAFRNVGHALLAMVPTLVGVSWMLGAMAALGFDFDAANIVALPLILGIGVDAGVHLVHRMRQSAAEHGGVASLEDVTVGTGGAVALASLTTGVGFASLMLADYGAMHSLGLAMTLGLAATLVASLLVLPSLMVTFRLAR